LVGKFRFLTGDRDVKGSIKCDITGVSRTHLPGQ